MYTEVASRKSTSKHCIFHLFICSALAFPASNFRAFSLSEAAAYIIQSYVRQNKSLDKAGLSGQGNCWPWIKEMAAVKHLLNLGGFSPFAIHHRLVWEGCISSLEEVLEFSTETDSNFCDMKPSTFLQVCYWIDGHKVAAAVAHKHTLWRKRQCLRVRLNWLQPQDRQNLKWYPLTLALHDGQQMSTGINVSKMFLRFPALRLFWAWTERQRWSHVTCDNKDLNMTGWYDVTYKVHTY